MVFPDIDPVLVQIGPFAIRWYALAYIFGIIGSCAYITWLNKKPPVSKGLKPFDDFLMWAVLGIILGGRIGYVLFYNFGYYISQPADILKVWQGGMSFHGGMLGVIVAVYLFAKKNNYSFLALVDMGSCAAPMGLFLGRLANFVNGELYGRVTDSPIGMIFPNGGPFPRHPSQLYEAFLEGIVLFLLLLALVKFTKVKEKPGFLSGAFLVGYGVARSSAEFFREPDDYVGFVTIGQFLSLPMIALGIYLMVRRNAKPA